MIQDELYLAERLLKKRVWRELEGDCAAFGHPGTDKLRWA